MAALPVAMPALRVTLQYRHSPELTNSIEFDIAAPLYGEPDQLYRFVWDLIFGDGVVSSDVEFRGFSSENQLVLQDNVIMPAGHIVHENLQHPLAGQIGVVNQRALVFLLTMLWRRRGHADWEWYSADAVDWHTFRANVGEIFAHSVLLAQVNEPELQWPYSFYQGQVPQDVQLLFQTFGNHELGEFTILEAEIQQFDGPLDLYNFIYGAVFGMAADDFDPVNFRGILGNNIHQENVNAVDVNPLVPNQTVGGQLGPLEVDGDVIGQFRINAQGQLVLLAIKWRAANTGWVFYRPQVHPWEEFRSNVRGMYAYSVLVAQF